MVGQDHISDTLRNAISSGRLAHAFLLCGPRGTGKTTTARLIAKCLNCEKGPTATPCNQCDFCVRVRDNQPVMDLVEIDAASNRGIDDAKELIEGVAYAPSIEGHKKVYIVDEVHMLTREAFNALLKTLEEPPPHAVFILATTDAHKVPATITSRCQRFDFRRVRPQDIVGRLQHVAQGEGFNLTPEAARLIALNADGGLRDALTLLEQVSTFSAEVISEADVRLVLGTVPEELMHALIEAVANRDAAGVLTQIEAATEAGASFSQLTGDLVNYCHDLLLLTVGFKSSGLLTDKEEKARQHYARQLGHARLMQAVEALRTAEKEMRQSTDHRLLLELTLVRAALGAETIAVSAAPAFALQAAAQTAPMVAPTRSVPIARRETQDSEPRTPNLDSQTSKIEPPTPNFDLHQPNLEPPAPNFGLASPKLESQSPNFDLPEPKIDLQSSKIDLPTPNLDPPASNAEPSASDSQPPTHEQPVWAPTTRKGRRIHNLEEFVELWPAVLMRVKKKIGITAVAYLHDAKPVALDDSDATLEFKKEFHYAKACDAAKRLPFEQVINECMAAPRHLKFRLAEPPPVAQAAPEAPPVASNEDDDFDSDIHTYAQELFAAEVVGRSGEG